MKSKIKYIVGTVLVVIFLIVGVPIIINEAYKTNSGYLTLWNAADVLSYYGTIIGAIATIIALVMTISFTRKQIHRDSYLKREYEKWSRTESVFVEALNNINPMRPIIETMDNGLTNPSITIGIFQKYQVSCRMATDQLNAVLNTADFPKVKILVEEINKASEKFFQICQEEVAAYSKLRDFLSRDTAIQTTKMEMKYPGSFSPENLSTCKRILAETCEFRMEDIQNTISQVNEKMISVYEAVYRSLLQLKGETFEMINLDIQKEADSILHLWRKNDAND